MTTELQDAIDELSATAAGSGQVMREAREEIERLQKVNGALLAAAKDALAVMEVLTIARRLRAAIALAESQVFGPE